jgi:hypothetical protein
MPVRQDASAMAGSADVAPHSVEAGWLSGSCLVPDTHQLWLGKGSIRLK